MPLRFCLPRVSACVMLCLGLAAANPPAAAADVPDAPSQSAEQHAEWVHVPANDDNMDFYVDRNSVTVHDDDLEFWDVVVFRRPVQKDEPSGRMIKEKRTLRRVSCSHQDQVLLKGSSFDEFGQLIESVMLSPATLSRVTVRAGTVASSELLLACRLARQDVPLEAVPRQGAASNR